MDNIYADDDDDDDDDLLVNKLNVKTCLVSLIGYNGMFFVSLQIYSTCVPWKARI
jgi:hypothetical protein